MKEGLGGSGKRGSESGEEREGEGSGVRGMREKEKEDEGR